MRALVTLLAMVASTSAFCAGPLTIVNPHIHEIEDGADITPGFSFVSGQSLFLDFQIAGFHVSAEKAVKLGYVVESLDPSGVRIMEPVESDLDTTLTEQDKDWKPIVRAQINIPPIAVPGTYKIVARVKDDLNGQTASKDLTYEVRAPKVEPSASLAVHDFHFYRAEEDASPLAAAAYRPGDTVWARFNIVGYKLGEANSVDVDYGIGVADASGKVLFSQPNAAVEKSRSYYPKPYVPGSMNLSLDKTIRPGQYAIVVTVRDHAGNQTAETKQIFSIEQ